jgi:hypothetical protein
MSMTRMHSARTNNCAKGLSVHWISRDVNVIHLYEYIYSSVYIARVMPYGRTLLLVSLILLYVNVAHIKLLNYSMKHSPLEPSFT